MVKKFKYTSWFNCPNSIMLRFNQSNLMKSLSLQFLKKRNAIVVFDLEAPPAFS